MVLFPARLWTCPRCRETWLLRERQCPGRRQAAASLDVERPRRELRRRVADVRGLLGANMPTSRQILRRLLVGRLTCQAFEDGQRRGYRFTGQGLYASILPVNLTTPEVVTPAGFEPAISTLKGLPSLLC
ncbi:MAG: hypothetical protein ACREKS_08185 [Candidatus Rokuibacteriota bacterium]